MKNVLLLNAGTRNTLVKNFKQTANKKLKIIATDSFVLAPALYDADKFYITPWINDDKYWDIIENICIKENIGLIVSLIDPELELLAQQKERFLKHGILLNTSDYSLIHDTYDKFNLLEFLRTNGFPWIQTCKTIDEVIKRIKNKELRFPLFIKPNCGSGSQDIKKIESIDDLTSSYKDNFIVQEFMTGQEIGVDVYVDLISGEVISIFAKKKLKMRAGETDKSISFKDIALFETIKRFVKLYGLKGANDIDVFERDGDYFISEVNPRFGGGYLHAYACGVDFPRFLINNMNGIINEPNIGDYKENVYMMKYFDIKTIEGELNE